MSKSVRIVLVCSLTCLCLLCSCGRKGPPKPPEEISPEPVRFLELVPSESGVRLRFQAPLKTVGGDDILLLREFEIGKRALGAEGSSSFQNIAEIEFEEDKNNPKVDWFEYEDQGLEVGSQMEYEVVAVDDAGYVSKSPYRLRVTFLGINSVIENLPLEED